MSYEARLSYTTILGFPKTGSTFHACGPNCWDLPKQMSVMIIWQVQQMGPE